MDERFEFLDEHLEERLEELRVPSLVAGVARGGQLVWSGAVGYSDLSPARQATVDTPYSLASITKPIVGTLISIYVERGLIDLNSPIQQYLKTGKLTAWQGRSDMATVGRVANHTSGLPLHFQFYFQDESELAPPFEETLAKYGNVIERPGDYFVYSNLGYGLLGHVLETVSGKPLADLIGEEIFSPLGMDQSLFAPSAEAFARCAARYDNEGARLPNYVTDHPGASEAFASLNDLLQFGSWHINEQSDDLLSVAARRRMRTPIDGSAAAQAYGLGWRLGTMNNGEPFASHSGGMDGVATRLMLLPESGHVIAVLCNRESTIVEETMHRIFEALGFVPGKPEYLEEPVVYTPAELEGTWKGSITTYAGDFPIELRLSPDGEEALICGQEAPADFKYPDGKVEGDISAELAVPDAMRTPHSLLVSLRLTGNRLHGVVTARSTPGPRVGNALSFPTTLDRVSGTVVLDENPDADSV